MALFRNPLNRNLQHRRNRINMAKIKQQLKTWIGKLDRKRIAWLALYALLICLGVDIDVDLFEEDS